RYFPSRGRSCQKSERAGRSCVVTRSMMPTGADRSGTYAGRVTIHSEHPFVPPDDERDPLRRLRGRLPAPVTVWAAGEGRSRRGLTVSSLIVAAGDPARVLGLVDEESDLWDPPPSTLTVNVLSA